MKYLIYSILFFSILAHGDELLPEGTEFEAAPLVEEAPLAPAQESPSLALPVEPSPAVTTATNASVSTSTTASENPAAPEEPVGTTDSLAASVFDGEEGEAPVDITAQQPLPPPVAAPQVDYGPSSEEGYGSIGLKNDGQFMEVGGEKQTKEIEEGARKTSSLPEELEFQ